MASGTINHDTTKENSTLVFYAVLISAILITAVIIWSLYYFRAMVSQENNRKQNTASRVLSIVKLEEGYSKNLNSLKWVNTQEGRLLIPINMAMDNVVKDYNK